MKLYSTNKLSPDVDLKEAVLRGLPPDNGLYMPYALSPLPAYFFNDLGGYSIAEIGYHVCKHLFQGYFPVDELEKLLHRAMDFPAPAVQVGDGNLYSLELFHGPSLAFKDFGARFMAELMGYFNKGADKELVILVATSGDTGGAVANGFVGVEGVKVCILYPSGKVSALQEKQLTTHGQNITAVEVDGSFDDCQKLVKQAFLDDDLQSQIRLSSANSINIARLIPQTFYYFEAYKQLLPLQSPIVFSVPSGNFGNLTAGLFAKRMGLPVYQFIAATNANDVVPRYLNTGKYNPKPSVRTISNAMDVGNPSNFRRMQDLFCSTWNNFKDEIVGYAYSDHDTISKMRSVFTENGYLLDPHGAVALLALEAYITESGFNGVGVFLETAHPAKFLDVVEDAVGEQIPIPNALASLVGKEKQASDMSSSFSEFKEFLLNNF